LLVINKLKVQIMGLTILRGISLEVPSGELICLAGRNGAGKTTTLKSILGIIPVSEGTIEIDGHDITRVKAHNRVKFGIGYMPEDRRLIPPLTVEENILLPGLAIGLERCNERRDYIYDLMPDVKLLAQQKASQLSGGQQKMVTLARAIMTGSSLLVLDEPFEGLSPGMGDKIGKIIQDLAKERFSLLIVQSDTKRIRFAKNIYTMERGEIINKEENC
jgi:branched-chain amino acid transport system ATP-binding protein